MLDSPIQLGREPIQDLLLLHSRTMVSLPSEKMKPSSHIISCLLPIVALMYPFADIAWAIYGTKGQRSSEVVKTLNFSSSLEQLQRYTRQPFVERQSILLC